MPKATMFGRQSWTPAAISAIQPNTVPNEHQDHGEPDRAGEALLAASQASPIGVFWMMP